MALIRLSCSLATTAGEVLAETKNPAQPVTTKSLTPACAMVGTSGRLATRSALVTARARSFPARICGSACVRLSNMKVVSPDTSEVVAGTEPR
ncbi:hypothetical protein D3C79_1022730 [compost metagenome]